MINFCLTWSHSMFIGRLISHCFTVCFVVSSLCRMTSLMFLNSSFSIFDFNYVSIELIKAPISCIVLSQFLTMSFIRIMERFFNLVNQLCKNSWFYFPILGSSLSFKPFGTNTVSTTCHKKDLWDSHLATFLSKFFSAPIALFSLKNSRMRMLFSSFH